MITKQDVSVAKKRHDSAWKKVVELSEKAGEALAMAERIPARDTSDEYVQKAKDAMDAMNEHAKVAREASQVLVDYHHQFTPK